MFVAKNVHSPQSFLKTITNKCFIVEGDNDIDFIHDILVELGYEDEDCCTLWDYPLDEIDEIVANDISVVLVGCCVLDGFGKIQKELRWFQIPDESVDRFREVQYEN